jgi:hypothetical protein
MGFGVRAGASSDATCGEWKRVVAVVMWRARGPECRRRALKLAKMAKMANMARMAKELKVLNFSGAGMS